MEKSSGGKVSSIKHFEFDYESSPWYNSKGVVSCRRKIQTRGSDEKYSSRCCRLALNRLEEW